MARLIFGQFLAWIGIVGGALIIADQWINTVNHWSNFITLPRWAILAISNFAHIMYSTWHLITSRFHIDLSGSVADLLSITAFYLSLATGSALLAGQVGSLKKFMSPILIMSGYFVLGILVVIVFLQIRSPLSELIFVWVLNAGLLAVFWTVVAAFIAMEGSVLERVVDTALYCVVCYLMSGMVLNATSGIPRDIISPLCFAIIFLFLLWFVPLLIAAQKALMKRLAYLLIGLAIIFGLSEVSKQVEKLRTAANPAAVTEQH
jgi:hypothetical protein